MGYYRQLGQEWEKEQRVIDAVREIAEVVMMEDGKTISASQFLEHFMFTPGITIQNDLETERGRAAQAAPANRSDQRIQIF